MISMANSRNHYPHTNAQIACRMCNQIFPNREALIAHIDSHLAREEVNLRNYLHLQKASPREAVRSHPHHQLSSVPNNNLSRASLSNLQQQVNRNVFESQPLVPEVNRNFLKTRSPMPEVNRNGFDARSLMQKVGRNDFNALPLMQEGNRINVANTLTFSWTSQPHPSSTVALPAPQPRRNPSLLTYVPPSTPAGSLQAAQLGFPSSTTMRNSTRGGATHRQQSQQRNVVEEVPATTEQVTRPFIVMLERPFKKVDFIDLENMDGDDASAGSQKLDLALKL